MARTSILPGRPTGELRILGPFDPPGVGRPRLVRLYVPRGYDEWVPHRVLFMFDGQNVFDDGPSFAGGWHLDAVADKLATKKRKPPIVVGIDHGGDKRIEELNPFASAGAQSKLDALLEWMIATVVPLVGSQVHIGRDAVHTAIGGSSMGGLAAMYAHYRRPDAIGGAISMSPSFWLSQGRILQWVESQPTPAITRVYLDCGVREGRGGMIRLAERMAHHLRSRGYNDESLWFRADPRGAHSEADWRRRAPAALRWMYR